MRLPTLATLGCLLLTTSKFVTADMMLEARAVDSANAYSDYYNQVFGQEDSDSDNFELVEEPAVSANANTLAKRATCSEYHTVSGSDTCIGLTKKYGIHLDDFYNWNPQVNHKCTNLNDGKKYCVGVSASSSGSGSSTSGCSKTHVVSGSDTCESLAKEFNISLNTFYSLNPKVHRGSCDNLDNGKSYCVQGGSSHKGTQLGQSSGGGSKKKHHGSKKQPSSGGSGKKEQRKRIQSNTAFTYYWIADPSSYSNSGKMVTVKTCGGQNIGKVHEDYADALVMEGTGVLGSKIVNLGGCSCNNYKCFELVDKSDDPFGLTAYGSPLRPYITIAANDISKGTKIFVPQLVGWKLPNSNKRHNGCLLVEDQSWSFGGHHIDFYVYQQSHYKTLDKSHRITKVDIYEGGSCQLLNYL
ncbi:hypothetical protein DM01DRAFT_1330710 [Hesseltinella vesiculosa]|uniref:LysM domain-containing protein n=1 Tax=Hesseltinella vesiculosa TaxID=101127 RepID=A0A1X2GWX1_9FUNG|nr:hypothetical protein DM01DRAFT_1330710 [Hesseltinella vesiculosa]